MFYSGLYRSTVALLRKHILALHARDYKGGLSSFGMESGIPQIRGV